MSTWPLLAAAVFLLSELCSARPVALPIYSTGVAPTVLVEQPSPARPYEFGFEFGDGLGMSQHRREIADGTGTVRGSYGYVDPLGVRRVVQYTADRDGYRTVVRTNEPGVGAQNTADALFLVQPPPPAALAQGIRVPRAKWVI